MNNNELTSGLVYNVKYKSDNRIKRYNGKFKEFRTTMFHEVYLFENIDDDKYTMIDIDDIIKVGAKNVVHINFSEKEQSII